MFLCCTLYRMTILFSGLSGLLTAGESMGSYSSWQALSVQSWIAVLIGCQSDSEGAWCIHYPESAPCEPVPGDWDLLQNSNSDKLTDQWEIIRLPSASAGREWDTTPIHHLSTEVLGITLLSKLTHWGPVATSFYTDGQIHWKLDIEIPMSGSSLDVHLFTLSLFRMYSERPRQPLYHVFCVLSLWFYFLSITIQTFIFSLSHFSHLLILNLVLSLYIKCL